MKPEEIRKFHMDTHRNLDEMQPQDDCDLCIVLEALNIQQTATIDAGAFADGVERENDKLRAEIAQAKFLFTQREKDYWQHVEESTRTIMKLRERLEKERGELSILIADQLEHENEIRILSEENDMLKKKISGYDTGDNKKPLDFS